MSDLIEEGVLMKANAGDAIAIHSNRVGEPDRRGVIKEVRGPDGTPPYLVQWDDGREVLLFPSADCTITPQSETAA